jgi:hypothetical protein
MRVSRLTLAVSSSIVFVAVVAAAGRSFVVAAPKAPVVQAAQTPPPPPHEHPAPTNLKVLPRNLTGEQVHEIMEQWEGELGSGCKTCHAVDPKKVAPNGRPVLNFADDSKKEKQTARKMYKMTEEINANYIAKIDSSGAPVTCGTCHRGHLGPEPFVVPEEKEDHDHAH